MRPQSRRSSIVLAAGAIAFALGIVAYPLAMAGYPPMVDLPFHAAETAALRHYFDPAYHFREQFELRPFAVPYLSMYALGAVLMTVLPIVTSVKIAAATMLALLPAGLAVLAHGMKKSPLLGLAGLVVVWAPLTHWGFLNFLGALGLFAMAVGLALLIVEHPTRARRVALAAALGALFVTHVFRFPFAIAAVAGAALVMAGGVRRARPIALPVLLGLALFAAWMMARPATLPTDPSCLALHLERLGELPDWLHGAFTDPAETSALVFAVVMLGAIAIVSAVVSAIERRSLAADAPSRGFRARVALVALGCATASLLLYLMLPMQMGNWWYVYPREATATCFLGLALLPDLPRAPALRAFLGLALALSSAPMAAVVARSYAGFDLATRDFQAITRAIPPAPKLLYLVFDHDGSTRTTSPFTHLPAWVQAERGGALSYHFAIYGASPLNYRPREGRESIVPPPTPPLWERTPEAFDVLSRGAFFDWFLVRRVEYPEALFATDPSIELEAHEGTWWLYRRHAATEAPSRWTAEAPR